MRNVRVGTLAGIPLYINPSWFLVFGLTVWLLAFRIFPEIVDGAPRRTHVAMALVSALVFFASIVLHELAHSLVAKAYKIPVRSITLFIFGGVAHITREASRPAAEILMAAAGPLTSLVLGAVFLGAWAVAGADLNQPSALDTTLFWLAWMNILLGLFNLLPAFPMDGGRVFRSLIWLVTGSYDRATRIAAWTGRGFAWTLIGLGALAALGYDIQIAAGAFGGLWLIFIGLFLESGARQSLVQQKLVHELGRHRVSDLMVADPPVVGLDVSVATMARGVLELNPRVAYCVEDAGAFAGIVGADQLRAVPELLWDRKTAGETMVPRNRLRPAELDASLTDALLAMEELDLVHMPVVREGRVVGLIARDRIVGVLRQAGLVQGM
ncbi:MAG: site-2 protease family protein [Dehalococcoidia bacterium]|nr:site-2 protease family protein [Dehalococcoidia bacterium]MCA9824702.1 site-2 protease family protein [Dehalococcoidia bacterium]